MANPTNLNKTNLTALESVRHNRFLNIDAEDIAKVMTPECSAAMVYYNEDKPKDSSFFNGMKDKSGIDVDAKLNAAQPTTPRPVATTSPANAAEQKVIDEWDALKTAADQATQIKLLLDPVFKSQTDLDNATQDFTKLLMDFAANAKEIPFVRSAESLYFTLCNIIESGRKAINDQYDYERAELTKLFTDPTFQALIGPVFGLPTPHTATDLDELQKSMLEKLEQSRKQQIDEYEKRTNAPKQNLVNQIKERNNEMNFIRSLSSISKVNKNEIAEISKKFKQEREAADAKKSLTITFGINPDDEDEYELKGVHIRDLSFIMSPTGSKIVRTDPATDQYTLKFSMHMLRPWYYGPMAKAVVSDFALMASTIRELKYTEITMNMRFNDEKTAKKIAIKAYEGCIEAGFPPDKIHIMDPQGKEYSAQDLETDKLKGVQELRAKQMAARDKPAPMGAAGQKFIKENLDSMRARTSKVTTTQYDERVKQMQEDRKKPQAAAP